MLAPFTSSWGQTLLGKLSRLFDQSPPIGKYTHQRKPYGGTVGGVVTQSANTRALSTQPGYFGDIPQDEQPEVQAAKPWQRL